MKFAELAGPMDSRDLEKKIDELREKYESAFIEKESTKDALKNSQKINSIFILILFALLITLIYIIIINQYSDLGGYPKLSINLIYILLNAGLVLKISLLYLQKGSKNGQSNIEKLLNYLIEKQQNPSKSLSKELALALEEIEKLKLLNLSISKGHSYIFECFDKSRKRLSIEVAELGFRANYNLALGGILAVIGLSAIGYFLYHELSENYDDPWRFAFHFIPRLTFVLMIELFAYFFLSMYKTSLSEIKYFQNELTNIEGKQIALHSAFNSSNSANIADVISKLSSTERNRILNKNQTTVDLELAKIDRENKGEIIKNLSEILKSQIHK